MLKPRTRWHRLSSTRYTLLTDSVGNRAPIRGSAFCETDPKKATAMVNVRYPRTADQRLCPGDTLRCHGGKTTTLDLTVVATKHMRLVAAASCNKEAGTQSRAIPMWRPLVGKKSSVLLLLLFQGECRICTETTTELTLTARPRYYPCRCISTSDLHARSHTL